MPIETQKEQVCQERQAVQAPTKKASLKLKERRLASIKVKGLRLGVLFPIVVASFLIGVALRGKHERDKFDIPRSTPPQIRQEINNEPKIQPHKVRRTASSPRVIPTAAPIAQKPQPKKELSATRSGAPKPKIALSPIPDRVASEKEVELAPLFPDRVRSETQHLNPSKDVEPFSDRLTKQSESKSFLIPTTPAANLEKPNLPQLFPYRPISRPAINFNLPKIPANSIDSLLRMGTGAAQSISRIKLPELTRSPSRNPVSTGASWCAILGGSPNDWVQGKGLSKPYKSVEDSAIFDGKNIIACDSKGKAAPGTKPLHWANPDEPANWES